MKFRLKYFSVLPDIPNNVKIEDEIIMKLYKEADSLAQKESKKRECIPVQVQKFLQPERPVKLKTWPQLFKCVIYLVQIAEDNVVDKVVRFLIWEFI